MTLPMQSERLDEVPGQVRSTRSTPSVKVRESNSVMRGIVLVALFSVAGVLESLRLSSLTSLSGADVWWHLRTGLWMLQNHGTPHRGIYSQSADLPWIAASWAFDLVVAAGYKLLGLAVIPGLLMFFRVMLAVITFLLAGGMRGRFWIAVLLSGVAQYILAAFQLTPAYCSIFLFGVELLLLFEVRRSQHDRALLWLAPLFLIWANVSPEFAYGIAALLLFGVAETIEQKGKMSGSVLLSVAASIVATVVTPYVYGPWGSFLHSVTSTANEHFPDHLAMRFHQPQDYLFLLLTMTAFLALGLRRSQDLFQILLLVGCASLSFYSQRDIWLVTMAAVAIIADSVRGEANDRDANLSGAKWAVIGAAILIIAVFALLVPHREDALLAKAAGTYPVAAADYIGAHKLPQPLFNSYEWGGFLIWYRPEIPVAIDGRTDLYPDDVYITYSKVMNADIRYTSYPTFAQARTILLPRQSIVAQALSGLPAFKVVYQDDVATVLEPMASER